MLWKVRRDRHRRRKDVLKIALSAAILMLSSGSMWAADNDCEVIAGRIATARAAHDLAALAVLAKEMSRAGSPCSSKAQVCLGRSIAIGHVAEVYELVNAIAENGAEAGTKKADAAERILKIGHTYGAPWQLLVAQADLALERAKRTHAPAVYSKAAYDYQLSLLDIGQDRTCDEYGEPPDPAAAQIAKIYHRMSMALLLASPLDIVTTKCSICEWAFLTGIRDFTPTVRPLPITFEFGRSDPTPEGRHAIDALLECLRAQKLSRIVLSGHTDEVGSNRANMKLSAARLALVQRKLQDGGYAGQIVLEPKGKSEPFDVGDPHGFTKDERRRLDRRIELRAFAAGEAALCAP